MEITLLETKPSGKDYILMNLTALLMTIKQYYIVSDEVLTMDDVEYTPDITLYKKSESDRGKIEINNTPSAIIELFATASEGIDDTGFILERLHAYFKTGICSYWMLLMDSQTARVYSSFKHYQVFHLGEIIEDVHLNMSVNMDDIFS